MLSKMARTTLALLWVATSLVFFSIVDAAEETDVDKQSCIEVKVKLTRDTGGVIGFAQAESKCSTSYGSMYLYAVVARRPPESDHRSYYGAMMRCVDTRVGANSYNNQASAVAHDYYNNQHVSALVRGRV